MTEFVLAIGVLSALAGLWYVTARDGGFWLFLGLTVAAILCAGVALLSALLSVLSRSIP
jgi:hypothetical protein